VDSRSADLTEQQRDFQSLCRKFVDERVIPFVTANAAEEWSAPAVERSPKELLIEADRIGLRDFGIPTDYDGIRVDTLSQTVMIEELGRGDPGFTACIGQNWKVTTEFARHASPELLDIWMDVYRADPTFLWAHCLTEPRGASDRVLPYDAPEASMQTRAVQDGDEWVLNGVKHYVSNAGVANAFIVFANTNPAAGIRDGVSNFLVPADTPGLSIGRINEKIGQRYNINAEIVLEDCRVPADYLLVRDVALRKNAAYMLQGRVLNAARALGVMQAAYEKAARFARETFQGGKLIIKHQIVAARLADLATQVEAARSLVYRAARAVDTGTDDAAALALMAKLHCSQVVLDVTRGVMELHAGSGVMVGEGVEKHFRDAAIFPHTDGTADITRFKIVKALFPEDSGLYAGPDAVFEPDGSAQPATIPYQAPNPLPS
jgi:alkylation response protein AidB-like acyl-CoA dehydrogenase